MKHISYVDSADIEFCLEYPWGFELIKGITLVKAANLLDEMDYYEKNKRGSYLASQTLESY